MMSAAYVPGDKQGKVVIEAIKCATMLDGLTTVKFGDKDASHDIHVFGTLSKWSANLRTWGEAGAVKTGKDGKSGDRGQFVMFVGYHPNHESDSVCMWDPSTNGVVTTRNVEKNVL